MTLQPPFRFRRSKWSLVKLLLLASLSLYLLMYVKWSFFDSDGHTPADQRIGDQPEASHSFSALQATQSAAEPSKPRPSNDIVSKPFAPKRKKPIAERLEVRKRRLDVQLKIMMPTVQGWGDDGKGVVLKTEEEKERAMAQFGDGAYNVYVSDRISVNRSLQPVAARQCRDIMYNIDELPNVSVIIIFTNEVFSALVRTVWSVINRTPKKLLKEIILVDDFSDRHYLRQTLRDYIDIYWNAIPRDHSDNRPAERPSDGTSKSPPLAHRNASLHDPANHPDDLVKLIHLPKRLGLIKARLEGARIAQGDVLLFLDSHCETTNGWLEPLVQRIKENNKVFICPVIDIISDKTLEYNAVDPYHFQLGGFDWTGHFTWINRRERDAQRSPTKPTKSPTMAGGLFAVDREYFFKIGSYDEDMKIWGGENLELSFRVWQCGGRVEIHPCSHVGHIFRDFHPYSFNGIDSHGFNTLRTVMVWMDEYSKYFFMSRPDLLKISPGDLSARYKLRSDLKCKSFSWYLENVYDGRKFVYDKNVLAYGWLKNKETNLCVDILNRGEAIGEPAGLFVCETMEHPLVSITNQLFSYSKKHQIRREEACLTIAMKKSDRSTESDDVDGRTHRQRQDGEEKVKRSVTLSSCEDPDFVSLPHRQQSFRRQMNQQWGTEPVGPTGDDKLLMSVSTGLCLTTEGAASMSDLHATDCDRHDPHQYWQFQIYTDHFKDEEVHT